MADKAPNILLLMTDQHKASATGYMGNRSVPTPFLDRLSKDGVVFEQAFAASSICTPSRTSIFTGVHPLVHDVTCHQNRAPHNLLQLSEMLQRHGYYTAVAGHYEPQRNLSRGWHEQVEFLERGPLHKSLLAQVSGARPDVGWSAGGFGETAAEGNSALLTDRLIRMLEQIENAPSPFFLHAAYDAPHPPYFAPPPYDSIVDPADIDLPPSFEHEGCPPWQTAVRAQLGTEAASESDIRKLLSLYYGMIAYADAEMQRLYEEMQNRGLLDNTWILFASDHGDYAGEKGMFAKTESLYECLLHVPLFIVPPAGTSCRRGAAVDELIDLVDLFPTILNIAGIDTPGYAQGRDLCRWLEHSDVPDWRQEVFAQVGNYHGFLGTTFPTGMPAGGRHQGLVMSARTKQFSYIADPDYGDEAYDLRQDPWEMRNLLQCEQDPPEVGELRESLRNWERHCRQIRSELHVVSGDRGFVEGWE